MRFVPWLNRVERNSLAAYCRSMVILRGSEKWAFSLLREIPSFSNLEKTNTQDATKTWLYFHDSESTVANVNKANYPSKLGTECDYLLFNLAHFDVDAFAALSGTVKAGGCCFLIIPENSTQDNLFLQRFNAQLFANKHFFTLHEVINLLPDVPENTQTKAAESGFEFNCKTSEQVCAVNAVIKVANGHRNRPLVFTADRGRGKSTALALACIALAKLSSNPKHITVTAANRTSLSIFFSQLKEQYPDIDTAKNKVVFGAVTLEFVAIDKLLSCEANTHMVLVDEAAAIPVYMLTQLAEKFSRIVFSSTVHGYEGAGRSFSITFIKQLNQLCPQFRKLHIHQPIRWCENDPLEGFVFSACLLNASLPSPEPLVNNRNTTSLTFALESKQQLIQNEPRLASIFALLVTAHYQTSPNDLVLLLNNDQVEVLTLNTGQVPIAVALVIREGNIEPTLIEKIVNGQRRIKGQFIPQSLLTHCGHRQSFDFTYLRIMRIAVHPQRQRQGIGAKFLIEIERYAQNNHVDMLGTSFGINEVLLSFWQNEAFELARIGFTKDKASGEHSGLLLKNLSEKSQPFVKQVIKEFYHSFIFLLADEYQHLPVEVVGSVLSKTPKDQMSPLQGFEQRCITDFANQRRQFSACAAGLQPWLLRQLHHGNYREYLPFIAKLLQKKTIADTCQYFNFSGKKALNQYFIKQVNTHLLD